MIKLISYYPFQNLLMVTEEFYEDKAIVKIKSFTFERQYEFEYKDVVLISDAIKSDYSQTTFSYSLLGFMLFPAVFFHNFIYAHPILLYTEQALYILGILLFISSFKRTWQIYFLAKNDDTLVVIKQTRQNRDVIPQIMEMIRSQAENIKEITSTDPFPDGEYKFEHVEYLLSSLSKITERVYEKEIIGYRQSPFGESVYCIPYNRLNGKVFHGKSSIDFAGWLVSFGAFFLFVYGVFEFSFAKPLHMHLPASIFYIILGLFLLTIILLPINLLKKEIIGLHNKNGSLEYSLLVNRKNKNDIEQIIEFVQSKIPAEEEA